MTRLRFLLLSGFACLLAGCETIDDLTSWMGSDDKTPLPGTRIAVLSDLTQLHADPALKDVPVTIPAITNNNGWPQAGGSPAGITGNLALSGLAHEENARIGDHNEWGQPLYANPIIADNVVYAMDAKGYITAHDASHIDKILWTNKDGVTQDEAEQLGGGLAFAGNKLYVTTGRGLLYALDARTGKQLWKQSLDESLRAAPKVAAGRVYALAVDNQLFAFDAEKGTQLWSHRGLNESAGFLAAATPSVTDTVVIAPYSSGVLHALDVASGQEVWSDALISSRRNSATGVFSGIGGNPIVKDDVVYAGSSNGFFAAMAMQTGRHIWEQNISTLNTPWVTDEYVYVLSSENELACLLRADGRVQWTKQLPRWGNEEKHRDTIVWRGPVMAGGELLIAGFSGKMLVLSPKDGSTLRTVDIPENITDAPIISGGRLYVLTQDAKLHVLY